MKILSTLTTTPRSLLAPLSLACSAFAFAVASAAAAASPPAVRQSAPPQPFHAWAKTPPMGWNSWDCFGTTITEEQARAQAGAQAEKLKPFGWDILTVDIQWYEPNSKGHDYKPGASLAMDTHSRLIPAPNRFPSSAGGAGFKPLADYIHAKGLRFGIHIMRGIPRQAVRANTPILGTTARAADIADQTSICKWNPDMFGVDMSKPGAQAYYDSLFKLYASWGVDFVKVDDIARPYDATQQAEIEAIRKAITASGRPIVLSLSPGDTPLARGAHVMTHANLWRISDDFWDNWKLLLEMFPRVDKWTPYRTEGAWPDADMLPFGIIRFDKPTRFTRDEQILCMTLWCIARSPLILGADMTKLDAFTLSLLTNSEVLAVNQRSAANRQLFNRDGFIGWIADAPESPDSSDASNSSGSSGASGTSGASGSSGANTKYLALFNTTETAAAVPVAIRELGFSGTPPASQIRIRDLWKKSDLPASAITTDAATTGAVTTGGGTFAPQFPAHGAGLYRIQTTGGDRHSFEDRVEHNLTRLADTLTRDLKEWKIPDRVFRVKDHGALGDGKTVNTAALQKTIDACSAAGGGTVLVSDGEYVTGTIELKTNVMLHVAENAKILGSTNLDDYPDKVESFKSVMSDVHRYRISLIYAEKAANVGICGKGEIYFRGEQKNFPGPETISSIEGRPFGIRMIECRNIVLKDITLRNSAAWMQSYLCCHDMIFDGIKVFNHANYNNDALDPDGCKNIIVRNCFFSSHDDAMCLKGASAKPCENILIENSTFHTTCNALKLGTDTQGDFRNIIARNLTLGGLPDGMESFKNLYECSTGITLATVDGGNVENIFIENVTINRSRCPVFIRIGSRGRRWNETMKQPGHLKDVVIRNITGTENRRQGSLVSGIKDQVVESVLIKNMDISMIGGGTAEMANQPLEENDKGYPDAQAFSREGLPAHGFYIRHARNVTLENVKITPGEKDRRPEFKSGGNVENVVINGLPLDE